VTLTIGGTPQAGDAVTVTLGGSQRRNPFVRWWQNLRRRHVVAVTVGHHQSVESVAMMAADAINARKLGVWAEPDGAVVTIS
jgi:hypothetical protein